MSDEIHVGDLVVVAYLAPCCGYRSRLHGLVFYVAELGRYDTVCNGCGTVIVQGLNARRMGTQWGTGVRLLKKIEPPKLNDEVEHDEGVTA